MRLFSLILYYIILNKLPHSTVPLVGMTCERIKEFFAKRIFLKCGKNVNIGKGARFGDGKKIEIGDNSSLGINCKVPSNIIIKENVMMGPNVTIYSSNHEFSRTDIPMIEQGYRHYPPVIINNDVWIGGQVIIMPGITIHEGTIIAAGSVVTKIFPEFSIIGGNPARFIKSRK